MNSLRIDGHLQRMADPGTRLRDLHDATAAAETTREESMRMPRPDCSSDYPPTQWEDDEAVIDELVHQIPALRAAGVEVVLDLTGSRPRLRPWR